MPNLVIKPRTPARFDGDFQVEPVEGYEPPDPQKEYIALIDGVLRLLEDQKNQDAAGSYSSETLAVREAARKTAAAELEVSAKKAFAGELTLDEAKAQADAIRRNCVAATRFAIKDTRPPRFEGDFSVLAEHDTPTDAEHAYLDEIDTILKEFAGDEQADPSGNYSQSVLENKKRVRKGVADQLREDAKQFCSGQLNAATARRNALILAGRYRALRDRLGRRLFNVYEIKHGEAKKKGDDDLVVSLDIRLVSGLPAPDDKPSPEKEAFYVELTKAITVINTVCQRMENRATGADDKAELTRILRLRDEYCGKLAGLGQVGLELPHTALAKLGLSELKNEFVAQEAGRIKNTYVRWLGLWSGLAAVVFLLAYVLVVHTWSDWTWLQIHKSFLLAAMGAAMGTWISFSVRQVQLSFEDLLMLEEDALDPPMRVIFVVGLTLTACLLFWTGTINLEIGGLKTNAQAFKQTGSVALLIGLFSGLSERALATAISGRAAAFVQGIAGGR